MNRDGYRVTVSYDLRDSMTDISMGCHYDRIECDTLDDAQRLAADYEAKIGKLLRKIYNDLLNDSDYLIAYCIAVYVNKLSDLEQVMIF